ncbi:heavy-metal-associated domain-containing protein [Yinghuangia sp. YIM S09857]|uniref:heavy-metal-associated domain-containing protein n=1 Tax=Yinghuangia sp. YIM S09857 TaxID=3436929 RepID=UPI003F52C248
MSTPAATSATTTTYTVMGMTCGHCVSSVTAEVRKVAGVTGVQVDLASGRVTVASDGALDDAAVAAAVTEAGYEVAAPAEAPAQGASCCGSCN